MPNTDHDPLGPGFDRRLKAALDRITPSLSPPRYAEQAMAGLRPWRMASALVAVGAACLLAMTAVFATGSPNPVVWTQRAATTIESVGHAPEASPSPAPGKTTGTTPHAPVKSVPQVLHEASPSPKHSEQPLESPRPEPSDSGDSHGDHHPESSPGPSPSPSSWPSPGPRDH